MSLGLLQIVQQHAPERLRAFLRSVIQKAELHREKIVLWYSVQSLVELAVPSQSEAERSFQEKWSNQSWYQRARPRTSQLHFRGFN